MEQAVVIGPFSAAVQSLVLLNLNKLTENLSESQNITFLSIKSVKNHLDDVWETLYNETKYKKGQFV